SDAGGSIRHPAALAGVAGLRPREGAISDDGQVNGALSGQSTGLIAPSVDDIATIVARCPSLHTAPDDRAVFDGAQPRIGVPDISWVNVDPAAAEALRTAMGRLRDRGYEIVETPLWQTGDAHDDFFLVMGFEN